MEVGTQEEDNGCCPKKFPQELPPRHAPPIARTCSPQRSRRDPKAEPIVSPTLKDRVASRLNLKRAVRTERTLVRIIGGFYQGLLEDAGMKKFGIRGGFSTKHTAV